MGTISQSMRSLFSAFKAEQSFCVAYSGGIDSQVLLHALVHEKPPGAQVRAIHIHHGLQAEADRWIEHCREQAQALDVSLAIKYVQAKARKGESPEAAARKARYAALGEEVQEGEVLLTAHNQNDQAETVFLQLLRGAGVKGLSAMPLCVNFSRGQHYRPLLNLRRDEIEGYAQAHQLSWIEDPSNQNTDFDRNYLRQTIMPLLGQRWPSFAQTVSRSAEHCAEACVLIEAQAEADLKLIQDRSHSETTNPSLNSAHLKSDNVFEFTLAQPLSIKALMNLSDARQRQVLRLWLTNQQRPLPSTAHLDTLMKDVLHAADDKNPWMHYSGTELRRFKGYLFAISAQASFDSSQVFHWDRSSPLHLPEDLGVLDPEDPRLDPIKKDTPLTVRFRQGGERMRIKGRQGQRTLKHLFQEWGVLPWRRDRIPLVFVDQDLVLVLLLPKDRL